MAVELYEVRENMESLAARLAAERATPQVLAEMEDCLAEQQKIVKEENAVAYSGADHRFHLLIYDASGNELPEGYPHRFTVQGLPLAFKLSPTSMSFSGITGKSSMPSRRRTARQPKAPCGSTTADDRSD